MKVQQFLLHLSSTKILYEEAELNNNHISLNTRKELAKLAFCKTAYYDSLIANWFLQKNELLEIGQSLILPLKKENT